MRKVVVFILSISLLFAFIACAEEEAKNKEPKRGLSRKGR